MRCSLGNNFCTAHVQGLKCRISISWDSSNCLAELDLAAGMQQPGNASSCCAGRQSIVQGAAEDLKGDITRLVWHHRHLDRPYISRGQRERSLEVDLL